MPTAFAKQGVVNCQGVPADRAAIQTAIDDLSNDQVLLKGLCQLDGQKVLIFRSNFTLKGEVSPTGAP